MRKTGEVKFSEGQKSRHMEHFGTALQKALDKWEDGDPEVVNVSLEAKVSKNPGGVKEYRVTISD